jgi:CheY-like chemotaxis protein
MRHLALFDCTYSIVRRCDSYDLFEAGTGEDTERRQRIIARKLRIFLVDDDSNFRKAFGATLHDDYGATIDDVNCGEDAFAKPIDMYDVIFVDVVMPGMSGIDVCERLLHRQLKALIALMSTNPDNETAAEEQGVSFYDKMDVARLEEILLSAVEDGAA